MKLCCEEERTVPERILCKHEHEQPCILLVGKTH